MNTQQFEYVRNLVREHVGLVLDTGKEYLVESRLGPVLRRHNLESFANLVSELARRQFNCLHRDVIEAMMTTETSFFRDREPFQVLQKRVLPSLLARRARARTLRIWSGACSSGQEVYSIAMLLQAEFGGLPGWNVQIIASDYSMEMLNRARAGLYHPFEVNRGLPAAYLVRFFHRHGADWQLDGSIRQMVEFRPINLTAPWPVLPQMDVILLRNVLIYFDVETKKTVLGRVARQMRPDGHLFLGGAETTFNLHDGFRRMPQENGGVYELAVS